MWLSKRNVLGILGVLVVVGAGVSILYMNHASHPALAAAIDECLLIENENQEIDCLYRALEDELHDNGIEASMHAFRESYRRSHAFASTGCHRHAHRIGDMVYYDMYWSKGYTVPEIDFPQETTACGYGFFHGFLEHLVQDRPDPVFVTEVCEGLRSKYSDSMHGIGYTCYHGSGHGFTLAQLSVVPQEKWGDIHAFTTKPLEQCNALASTNEYERGQCFEGVFNVIVEWMKDEEYQFVYNEENPFLVCQTFSPRIEKACAYEMSQKLDGVADLDPVRLAHIIEKAPREDLQRQAFAVGIAGILQQRIADPAGYTPILERCRQLRDALFVQCVDALVHGVYDHGEPREQYKLALALCEESLVIEGGAQEVCYKENARQITNLYSPRQKVVICQELPASYRDLCEVRKKTTVSDAPVARH